MAQGAGQNKAQQHFLLRFIHSEIAGGAVLFVAALLAIVAANTEALREGYEHFRHLPVGFVLGAHTFQLSLAHFVNDGLMAIFFFLVGLEIKRELLIGELSKREQAMLPAAAAAGGMLLPALIYAWFNWGDATAMRGWAIPTATDIAFSLGVLSLLGARVPLAVKVFLTAVAIIDDLGAIAIIAFFYTDTLHFGALAMAALVIFVMMQMNRRLHGALPYLAAFVVLWACTLQSGVHATLAGVAAAFAVPLRTPHGVRSTLVSLEHNLHALVIFFIVPLFAFVNAGVSFQGISVQMLGDDIPLGIALGLFIGKAVGIPLAVWLAVKTRLGAMPEGCGISGMVGIAMLCGIGFTVSLFIGNLSFTDAGQINLVKIGVLLGSTLAGVCGFLWLRFVAFNRPPAA